MSFTQGIIPKMRGIKIKAIIGEMMLCASLKLLAKKESVIKKEAKKMVSGNRSEKNKSIFKGCNIGPICEANSPIRDPMDIIASPILVIDKLAANKPEQTMSASFPKMI